ncbi:PAP2 family protein [Campylobacter sp. MIT 12-5580]|uniref:phosphatase PAP2 family protein n=1 Tax=Campylobacter sp. MIT 12-5580 TaxID=2040651 RepID=UPI0010F5035A|nr:phosphatase PAP2 family protein [Campylobacter sp. MIT 12-5580]TKX30234.1 PAP2 family protein [Campylobacter sp. MIT 12-5580]
MAMGGGHWIEKYGDVMQFLPLSLATYTLATQDYEGFKQLALGSALTLASTYAVKYSFVALSKHDEHLAQISQRPKNGSFDGFPSGHTSFAFVAAGFSHKRYGLKASLPFTLLASTVGASRIHAQRHTTAQVIAGAVLGYSLSYFSADEFDENLHLAFLMDNEKKLDQSYQNTYKLVFSYKF